MVDFLVRLFLPHISKQNAETQRQQYGRFSSIVGIVLNLLLALSKIVVGLFSGAVSVLGDGINNLSDAGSSILSLFSFMIASKPADAKHPFGHARIEYIASSAVAVVIAQIGLSLFMESADKTLHPQVLPVSGIIVGTLLASIIVKGWLYLFYKKMANRIQSELLHATAADSFSDVLATSSVLIALLLGAVFGIGLDGPMGIVVSVLLFRSACGILRNTLDHLLGRPPHRSEVDRLRDELLSYEGVLGIHDMVIHDYGPGHQFVTVHVEVDARVDVLASHAMIDQIERDIRQRDGLQLTIHMDPLILDDPRTNEVRDEINALIRSENPDYSIHDFRLVESYRSLNLVFDLLIPATEKKSEQEVEQEIRERIEARFPTYHIVLTVDRDFLYSVEEEHHVS
ncbi:MAG: cation diffusion facilitator family transporter [Ndongobacter sp.]|nr:cation diffusion facilitator family transporter [Ndongobacter sp.]